MITGSLHHVNTIVLIVVGQSPGLVNLFVRRVHLCRCPSEGLGICPLIRTTSKLSKKRKKIPMPNKSKKRVYALRVEDGSYLYYQESFIKVDETGPIEAAQRVVGKLLQACVEGQAIGDHTIMVRFLTQDKQGV